jgi:hypothetical protein
MMMKLQEVHVINVIEIMLAPVDYEFEVGMIEQGLPEPLMSLPEAKDTLYVTKPIDKYEPLKVEK